MGYWKWLRRRLKDCLPEIKRFLLNRKTIVSIELALGYVGIIYFFLGLFFAPLDFRTWLGGILSPFLLTHGWYKGVVEEYE